MKKEHLALIGLAAVAVAVLVAVDMWRSAKTEQPQTDPAGQNCLNFSITIKRSDVGAIPFAAIPAMIDKTGLKRTVLETDTLVYEGSADAVVAFEAIAHGQGWNYYKSNKNC